jgi:NurA-like 5'-3' nuclease
MSIDRVDQSIMDEIDYTRRARRGLSMRIKTLEKVTRRYSSRIDASRSPRHKRVLDARKMLVIEQIRLLRIEQSHLQNSWSSLIVHAKLRGLADDRRIAQWQGEDHV